MSAPEAETQRFRKAQVYCANSYSNPFVGCIIASLTDILLACHAILPNERQLKQVVKKRRPITAHFQIWEVDFGPCEISCETLEKIRKVPEQTSQF